MAGCHAPWRASALRAVRTWPVARIVGTADRLTAGSANAARNIGHARAFSGSVGREAGPGKAIAGENSGPRFCTGTK
jgi:hypothetical protein